MARYRPNYWNNYPEPYYAGWASEPIPGWGVRPVMAGPARVGVGAVESGGASLAAFAVAGLVAGFILKTVHGRLKKGG